MFMETLNEYGMGYSAAGIVAVLFDLLVTKKVITNAEANAILDDAIALIRGQSDTVSTSDALAVIEDFREQLAKHNRGGPQLPL
jgi:hypothetical protein